MSPIASIGQGLAWNAGVKKRCFPADHSLNRVKERRLSRANPRSMPYVGATSSARVNGGDAEASH